ncbi:MAG: phosphoribosylformimino-5-aminoimidazole carboxamide ribotide isomerase [Chloroflexota bacterium]|nr:phosphoribosylformimino-5-aminoimidazole carboxamide ribotide isomerase [Chloroflexota bacterium]
MVIVPSVDVRAGRVRFRSGAPLEVEPRELAAAFVSDGAEELHLVDLDGAERGEYANLPLLTEIARVSGVPCRLAGGLASLDRAAGALEAGFAGVLFSSAVFGSPTLLRSIATLGDQAIVEIESKSGGLAPRGGGPELVARALGVDSVGAAVAAVDAGIRALYVIDLSTEGGFGGPALALLGRIREALHQRLGPGAGAVAHHTGGGVRDLADVAALARFGAASVVVGRALAAQRFTLADAKAAAA